MESAKSNFVRISFSPLVYPCFGVWLLWPRQNVTIVLSIQFPPQSHHVHMMIRLVSRRLPMPILALHPLLQRTERSSTGSFVRALLLSCLAHSFTHASDLILIIIFLQLISITGLQMYHGLDYLAHGSVSSNVISHTVQNMLVFLIFIIFL